MLIPTNFYEDVSDFATVAIVCTKCKRETPVVGPLPKKPTCSHCGSSKIVYRTSSEEACKNSVQS